MECVFTRNRLCAAAGDPQGRNTVPVMYVCGYEKRKLNLLGAL